MSPELAKCRAHYDTLSETLKECPTAEFLLSAIKIAEQAERDVEMLKTTILDNVRHSASPNSVTKPEGK